jgi:hypothetical protein
MPTHSTKQNPQRLSRRLMPFKQFIDKSVANAEKVRSRRQMLRGRKLRIKL